MKLSNQKRQMLEHAARALGIRLDFEEDEDEEVEVFIHETKRPTGLRRWNPFEDDGDALRLAVALKFHIEITETEVQVKNGEKSTTTFFYEDDPGAKTRWTIVDAAAEIGERMAEEDDDEDEYEDDDEEE